jgi:large subunit ribosomal protein L3
MLNTILGSKGKMGQTFVEGTRVPVTWIKAGPCIVTHIKNEQKDGYWAVQLGFGQKRIKNVTKPLQGHLRKVLQEQSTKNKEQKQNKFPRFLREVRLDKEPEFKVGDEITASKIFKRGDVVVVTGTSKGKGFAGVVKRWGFAGGPKTHGQSDRQRAPGSIGQGTTPGRVYKGKKMAGRMGGETVSVKNLIVVEVRNEDSMVALSGPVPGIPGGLLKIKKIKEGSLEELVEEVPQVEFQQGEEPEESTSDEGVGEAKGENVSVKSEEQKESVKGE